MSHHHLAESIFKSSIRVLFKAFFAMVGVALGLIAFTAIIGAFLSDSDDIERTFTPEILPNAQGVRKKLSDSSPVLLTINFNGIIGLDKLTMKNIRQQLVESREGKLKDDRVKGLVLGINTPGGGAIDSDAIYRAIQIYKEQYKVPVYAYVDGMCASGGMYIACAADKVFASESSLIGSVGVLLQPPSFNISKPLQDWGVQSQTFSAGKGKDEMNPFRPWKEGEGKHTQELVDQYYKMFVDIVVENRPKLTRETLVEKLGAEVFVAEKAKELGFIDGVVPTVRDVLKMVAKDLDLDDDAYQVIQLQKEKWFTQLFSANAPFWSGKVRHELAGISQPEFASPTPVYYLHQ